MLPNKSLRVNDLIFIIIILHDSLGQEFRQGTEGLSLFDNGWVSVPVHSRGWNSEGCPDISLSKELGFLTAWQPNSINEYIIAAMRVSHKPMVRINPILCT